jgi:hypothetical protein
LCKIINIDEFLDIKNIQKYKQTKKGKIMKKLTTTALVTSLMLIGAGSSFAQTTVSGNLNIGYRALSNDNGAASQKQNFSGMTKESQLNIANKGSLNNGMTYAAGFSLEFDGQDGNANSTGWSNENTYIDLIAGKTTITIGADHIQNPDVNLANILGIGYIAMHGVADSTGTVVNGSYPQAAASNYGAYGIGIVQNIDIGNLSINYTPSRAGAISSNDIFNNGTAATYEADESAYEIVFRGGLGVKGLTALASYMKSDAPDGATKDIAGRRLAAQYNFGQITVGADWVKEEGLNGATVGAAADQERTGKGVGIAYAVTPNFSIGANYSKTDASEAGVDAGVTEKYKSVAIGYNLGPVALQVEAKKGSDIGNEAGVDAEQIGLLLSTKF